MINFLKLNKSFITYSAILLIVISIFGLNFFINIIGNLLLLLFLIPLLLFLILLISLNYFKSSIKTCPECGAISLGFNNTCINCGADLGVLDSNNTEELNNAGETTIEVKAEEVK